MNLLENISKIVADAFENSGYDRKFGNISISNRPDLCEFQCNGALAGAKLYKKNPLEIAKEVSEILKNDEAFSSVEFVPPGFINIILNENYILGFMKDKNNFKDFIDDVQTDTIVLDYGGPNVAKPLHVGHMRSANIGEAIKRIGKAVGNNVIGDVHLGDWGMPLGLVIAEIKERYPDLDYFKADFKKSLDGISDVCSVTVEQLAEIYPAASEKSKSDEEFKKKALEMTSKLQNRENGIYDLWEKIIEISILDIKKIYGVLNVEFDYWYGESNASPYIPKLLDALNDKNLMYESDGAYVVDVAQEDDKITIPPTLILKSDGSQLYTTTDLATIIQREEDFKPNQYIYLTDSRQSLHFTQVFRCAKKAKIVPESTNLNHISFGTINGADGKPLKTRDGKAKSLEELITEMYDAALKKVTENFKEHNVDEKLLKEKEDVAMKVGVAALKFGDLYNYRSTDYVLDVNKFVSFEGKTGPYLLYTVARINSIVNKYKSELKKDCDGQINNIKIYSDIEKQLIMKLLLTEDVLVKSFNDRAPNMVCEHIYEISAAFNKFYDKSRIIAEENTEKQTSWITLCLLVRDFIISLLDVLAIETVERM